MRDSSRTALRSSRRLRSIARRSSPNDARSHCANVRCSARRPHRSDEVHPYHDGFGRCGSDASVGGFSLRPVDAVAALMDLEPREAADFTYVPTRPGQVMPDEWYPTDRVSPSRRKCSTQREPIRAHLSTPEIGAPAGHSDFRVPQFTLIVSDGPHDHGRSPHPCPTVRCPPRA